jgi:carbon monoxide dehydrogenase subunit G
MELKGERMLPADRATAWAALNDIEVLKLCVPGCEQIVPVGDNRYETTLNTAIGPVRARFKGNLELTDIDAPNAYTLKFEGSSSNAGFARGQARVTLTEVAPRQTRLDYVANAQVGGKLAQIGSRLIDAAAGAMADKFFEAFGAQLAARAAPAPAGAPQPAPPPQVSFGFWSLLKAFLRRLFGR